MRRAIVRIRRGPARLLGLTSVQHPSLKELLQVRAPVRNAPADLDDLECPPHRHLHSLTDVNATDAH